MLQKHALEVIEPHDWGDRPVWIIGGGPSVSKCNLEHLRGRTVLAVKDSARMLPWATCLWGIDPQWQRNRVELLTTFRGERWIGSWIDCELEALPGVRYVCLRNGRKVFGLSVDPSYVVAGGNSGYSALNFATLRGAKKIALVGFDMREEANATHWFETYPWRSSGAAKNLVRWAPNFDEIGRDAKRLGIEIVNTSPISLIKAFPYVSFEDTTKWL